MARVAYFQMQRSHYVTFKDFLHKDFMLWCAVTETEFCGNFQIMQKTFYGQLRFLSFNYHTIVFF